MILALLLRRKGKTMFRKYIGDRDFYSKLLKIMIPLLIQNVITNLVSLLDNIMVGQVGTEPMSGVAIVNQLLFIFNLCIFAVNASAGIYSAQFFGKGDMEGVRSSFRMKFWLCAAVFAVALAVLLPCGDFFIGIFLHDSQEGLDLAATLQSASDYLKVMYVGLLPFAIAQAYGSTLREGGETVIPMRASISAVFVNLILNYILIFGKLGAPAMGVVGAAIATVISRFVEFGIIAIYAHTHKKKLLYMEGLFKTLRVRGGLAGSILRMGFPLILNEFLWSTGMTMLNQCYSMRGLEVVSACNISSTVSNLFFCAIFAMGNTISIIVGQLLGAGELDRAVDEARKLIAFSVTLSVGVGIVLAFLAPLFPQLYNTTDMVKDIADKMILIIAISMPFCAFSHGCYFTLRSGGNTWITFLFDCVFTWVVCLPIALILSRFTAVPIIPMYAAVRATEIIKVMIGLPMLKSRKWVHNLVE